MTQFNTKIINLHGGPGIGKSTLMYNLTGQMRMRGYNAELVMEYAKELVFRSPEALTGDPEPIFVEQASRILNLIGHVEYIICDSPLLLSIVYPALYGVGDEDYFASVHNLIDQYESIDIYLLRSLDSYDTHGRTQTENEAAHLDSLILKALHARGTDYHQVPSRGETVDIIIDIINKEKDNPNI